MGRFRIGRLASPAVTRTISPPMNWNIAMVVHVLPGQNRASKRPGATYHTAKIRPPVPGIAGCLSFSRNPVDLYPGLISKSKGSVLSLPNCNRIPYYCPLCRVRLLSHISASAWMCSKPTSDLPPALIKIIKRISPRINAILSHLKTHSAVIFRVSMLGVEPMQLSRGYVWK